MKNEIKMFPPINLHFYSISVIKGKPTIYMYIYIYIYIYIYTVPDLPLCLGVIKHRAPLARGEPSSCQKTFLTMDFRSVHV